MALATWSIRREVAGDIADIPFEQLPYCIAVGIPMAMQCTENATYWGQNLNLQQDKLQQNLGIQDLVPMQPDAKQHWRQAQGSELNVRIFAFVCMIGYCILSVAVFAVHRQVSAP